MEEAVKDHDRNVRRLLERARSRRLKLNPEKFSFRKTQRFNVTHLKKL